MSCFFDSQCRYNLTDHKSSLQNSCMIKVIGSSTWRLKNDNHIVLMQEHLLANDMLQNLHRLYYQSPYILTKLWRRYTGNAGNASLRMIGGSYEFQDGHADLCRGRSSKATYLHTCLTALCPGLSGSAGTRKVKPIWILLSKRQWVAVTSAGPYASVRLAPDR